MIGCGTKDLTTLPLVGFFKMRNNGNYQYFFQITTTPSAACKGITYEDNTQTISVLFTTDDTSFNSYPTPGITHSVLLQYKEIG